MYVQCTLALLRAIREAILYQNGRFVHIVEGREVWKFKTESKA